MPGIMDEKDGYVRAEGTGSCAFACKAQASARVDVPTAPTTSHVIFPSIVGGYNMPGIMVQKDSYDRDEAADQAFRFGVML